MATNFNLRGRLTINIVQANNLNVVTMMGKMDPFCKVDCSGSEKFRTSVAQDMHQNPVWNNSMIFNLVGNEDLVHVHVCHKGSLTDDEIGRLDLPLDQLSLDGKPIAYELRNPSNFTKIAGSLLLACTFEGHGLPPGSIAFKTNAAREADLKKSAAPAAAAPAPRPVQPVSQAPAPAPAPAPVQPAPVQQAPPAQPVYGTPQQAYGQPQQVYQNPQQAYGQPQQVVYQTPQQAYGQPQQVVYQTQQPQVIYAQQPQVVYAQPQPQVVYGQPQVVYQTQQPAVVYGQPQYQPQQPYYR